MTKTENARQIPINEALKKLFNSLPRHIKSDYVFYRQDGKPYRDVVRAFKTAVRKTGIDDFNFHDLRHSFASKLLLRNVNLKTVQELLGHKDIKLTMRYSHLGNDTLRDVVKLLD